MSLKRIPPKCFHRFLGSSGMIQNGTTTKGGRNSFAIEVWTTTCIVTNFGKTTQHPNCSVLINPSNPELSGVRNFSYFPRGGPVPPKPQQRQQSSSLGLVSSSWGGLEIGEDMLFPASVIDGLVHQLGGAELQQACKALQSCPVGTAVFTTEGTYRLKEQYDTIIHTTPPFYQRQYNENKNNNDDPAEKLRQCYQNSFQLAFDNIIINNNKNNKTNSQLRVAVPLLGSGARGFPYPLAMEIASSVSVEWLNQKYALQNHTTTTTTTTKKNDNDDDQDQNQSQAIVFGLLEEKLAEELSERIEQKMNVIEKCRLENMQ